MIYSTTFLSRSLPSPSSLLLKLVFHVSGNDEHSKLLGPQHHLGLLFGPKKMLLYTPWPTVALKLLVSVLPITLTLTSLQCTGDIASSAPRLGWNQKWKLLTLKYSDTGLFLQFVSSFNVLKIVRGKPLQTSLHSSYNTINFSSCCQQVVQHLIILGQRQQSIKCTGIYLFYILNFLSKHS